MIRGGYLKKKKERELTGTDNCGVIAGGRGGWRWKRVNGGYTVIEKINK